MFCVDLVIRIVSRRRCGSGLCRGSYSLPESVNAVILGEKEENDLEISSVVQSLVLKTGIQSLHWPFT